MKRKALAYLAIAAAVAAAAGAGYIAANWRMSQNMAAKDGAQTGASASADGRKVLYWYDPMYPQHHFDKPGKSPFMDMALAPKYADEEAGGGVKIDPRLVQSLGMRLATVARERLETGVDAVASVGFNERDVTIVQARTGGFVERVYARAPGDVISAGSPLADVLVPEWAGAQIEFLALKTSYDTSLAAAARERLRLLGMPETLIAQVEHSGKPHAVLTITAPGGGVIQELGMRSGMTLSQGMTLARINGIASVWLEAAVPEAQAGVLQVGRSVEARFAAFPGETFRGKVAAVLPEMNRDTRTLRVRMEFSNPSLRLRPGMFAQVRVAASTEEALVVPAEAVIRTGKRTVVLRAEGEGKFRPVEIETGREADGKLVVLKGLHDSQQVVVSGQFLIDSEASLKGALDRMQGEPAAAAPSAPLHEATGKIEAIGKDEITLSHGPVPSMKWGAMTMPFKLPRPELGQGLKPGDTVRFAFKQTGEGFVIERIGKSRP